MMDFDDWMKNLKGRDDNYKQVTFLGDGEATLRGIYEGRPVYDSDFPDFGQTDGHWPVSGTNPDRLTLDEIFADSEEAFTFFDVPETKFLEIWESPIVQQAHLEPTKDHIVPRSLGMDMLLISAETFGLVSKRVHPKLNAYIVRAKCRPT